MQNNMVALTSSSSTPNTSLDFMRNNNNIINLHGPFSSSSSSFSYLTSMEDVIKQNYLLSGMKMNNNPEEYHDVIGIDKKASEDVEIGVFGAEKYFNGDMDSDHSPRLMSPLPNPEVPNQSSMISSETLSLGSESSWYSQKKKTFLANLGCRCVCSNWNSVDIVEEKTRTSGLKKIKSQLSLSGNLSSEIKIQQQQVAMLEQKKSLKHEEEEENGRVSDVSTDLFEIESLTGKANPLSSDQDSPNDYAPSEVSIQWSVVTASVADFSVMSECATSPVKKNWSFQIPQIPATAKSNRKNKPQSWKSSSGGLLLGCKSHKSVRISGDSYTSMNRIPSHVPKVPHRS